MKSNVKTDQKYIASLSCTMYILLWQLELYVSNEAVGFPWTFRPHRNLILVSLQPHYDLNQVEKFGSLHPHL